MSDEKKERARLRRIETGKELEGRGFLDQAVKEYVKAEAPEEAARALASKGRLADAANAILEALGVTASEAGSVAAQHREVLQMAAVFLEQTGDSTRASAILEALASGPSAPVAPSASSTPAAAPPAASARAPAPPASVDRPRPSGFRTPGAPPSSSGSFRAPSAGPGPSSFRPPSGGISFRPPARPPSAAPASTEAPQVSVRPPAETRTSQAPVSSPAEARATVTAQPAPARAPVSAQAPPARATPAPPTGAPASDRGAPPPEARLSASGEVVTEYAGSREAGWRDAGSESIDESIRQMLASGRKGAAARVAWDAGRHEQALEWFLELDLHYQAGACLRALGRMEEALERLLRVPTDGPHYRKACFELVPAAKALGRLDFDVDRFLARFVEHGPQDTAEIPTFLELAELYRERDFAAGAIRCVSKILALESTNGRALALRGELAARVERTRKASAPAIQRGLPELPTLEEFVALARANAPRSGSEERAR